MSAVLPISRSHDRQACFQRAEIHNIHNNMPSSAIVAINENADCIGWKWKYGLRLKRFRRYNMVASLGFPGSIPRSPRFIISLAANVRSVVRHTQPVRRSPCTGAILIPSYPWWSKRLFRVDVDGLDRQIPMRVENFEPSLLLFCIGSLIRKQLLLQ